MVFQIVPLVKFRVESNSMLGYIKTKSKKYNSYHNNYLIDVKQMVQYNTM